MPGVHADAGHLPHTGVSAVGADNQPGVDRLPLAQMQRRLRLAALHRFQFATDAQGNRLMRRQRLPQAPLQNLVLDHIAQLRQLELRGVEGDVRALPLPVSRRR